jgi:sortase A
MGMKDRRPVDELSIEKIERIIAIRKREQCDARLQKFRAVGRAGAANVIETVLPSKTSKPKSLGRRIFNVALLIIESGVVFGLFYVVINSANALQTLNNGVAQAIALPPLPSPSPTPLITAVVLPSGHTPPTSPGGSQPNLAEIPENLRPLVQSLPPIVIPTPSPQHAIRMVLPPINIDAPVVQGDSWDQLKKGIAQHLGTADPGQAGNMVVSAHNDIYGELFRDLDRLKPGDEVYVYTQAQKFTYRITGTRLVAPTEVSVMNPTVSPTLTLISCYPYLIDTQRIIVFAELKK